jgi:flagellar basal body-associated protein FliL
MADEEKPAEATAAAPAAAAEGGGSGIVGKILGIVLPTIFAGAAAFAGAHLGQPKPVAPDDPHKLDPKKVPGFTYELKAFVLNVRDEKTGENRPLKLQIAVELKKEAKKEDFDPFVGRARDTILGYIRTLSYEDVVNPKTAERITEDLLARVHKVGASHVQSILIQEMVTQ